MRLQVMLNLFLLMLLTQASSCDQPNKIDVEACKKIADECKQYSCLHPGCWCLLEEEGEEWLFDGKRPIREKENARALVQEYMQNADPQAKLLKIDDHGHGWFTAYYEQCKHTKHEHLTISPKGKICRTECGI